MASNCKVICSIIAIGILAAVISTTPVPEERSKIRIHVPVKHHTHYHTRTKTIIKPVHIPIKAHHHDHHEHHIIEEPVIKHHHRIVDVADEESSIEDWIDHFPKKKKFHHPFY